MSARPPMERFQRASKNVLSMIGAGFKGMFSGLFSQPVKFITFIALLIGLILVSYYFLLLLFLTPVILFYFALYLGRGIWEERKKRPVGRLGSIFIFLLTISIITPSIFGFLVTDTATIKPARLPNDYTDAGAHNGWVLSSDSGLTWDKTEQAGLVRMSSRTYEFEGSDKPPYPGLIFIITIKSSGATTIPGIQDQTRDEARRQLDTQVKDFDYDGLTIDLNSKVTGTRTIRDGHSAQYFEYTGKIEKTPSDPKLAKFVAGGKVKVRGEVWACQESGTIITTAGVAQYGYTFAAGTFKAGDTAAQKNYPDDYRTWTTTKNLINNVVCE